MPVFLARAYCLALEPTLAHVRALADTFRAPLPSAALRYVELTDAPCAVAYVRDGVIVWCLASPTFPVRLVRRMRLGEGARASSLASLQKHEAFGAPEPVPASAWTKHAPKRSRVELLEQSLLLGGNGDALAWLTPSGPSEPTP